MKTLAITLLSLSALWNLPHSASQEDAKPASQPGRTLFDVGGQFQSHTYKSDSNGHFQYGTPAVEPAFGGAAGLTTNKAFSGRVEFDGVSETIRTSHLPAAVLTAASLYTNPTLDLNETSLRLQNAWGVGGGLYLLRNFEVGARYSRDSWRYDWLGNASGTTIPYIKGAMRSSIGFLRYSGSQKRLQWVLDGGAGGASANFNQGVEANLHDGEEKLLVQLPSGISIPVSGRLGFTVFETDHTDSASRASVIVYGRYDYSETVLSSTKVLKRQIVGGVEFTGRSR